MDILCLMELYRYGKQILGTEISHLPPRECAKRYAYSFKVRGKTTHYFFYTHDPSISLSDCVGFATYHAQGKFRIIRTSLEGVGKWR